jgi:A/G-specific adenine glycosylase
MNERDREIFFRTALLEWHDHSEKRFLPWKTDHDAYSIWLSEIILQPTRVEQGTPYYLKFKENFPTVYDLANASEDHVLKLWEGLGYYSRARNLHTTAKMVRDNFEGNFPSNYVDVLSLKGVGEYTAAAIVSFAYEMQYPVVDGNVYRVLSRFFGIKTAIDNPKAKKEFTTLATTLIQDVKQPSVYNQAIMDFGATICKPLSPLCIGCPLLDTCVAHQKGLVNSLPVKNKKPEKKKLENKKLENKSDGNKNTKNRKCKLEGVGTDPA